MERIRSEILKAMAMVEALIDFGEGEDIEEGVFENGMSWKLIFQLLDSNTLAARRIVTNIHEIINSHISDSHRGEILRSGVRLAIFGPPNAGKSSLLNYLGPLFKSIISLYSYKLFCDSWTRSGNRYCNTRYYSRRS